MYPASPPSPAGEGLQGCFEILKVNTEYKLSLLLLEKGDREAGDEEFFASSAKSVKFILQYETHVKET